MKDMIPKTLKANWRVRVSLAEQKGLCSACSANLPEEDNAMHQGSSSK
jgi:hypothetical protein